MSNRGLHQIPDKDPVSGGELYISELASDDSGITIRGRFAVPRYARLDADQQTFLETFLRCRGVMSSVEKELGISYPTVRARLDQVLESLDLKPAKSVEEKERARNDRNEVLDQLERGEITAEEAKAKFGAIK